MATVGKTTKEDIAVAACELGFNLRGAVHYGRSSPLHRYEFSQPHHLERSLDRLAEWGARIVRVYVPHSGISAVEAADRLTLCLELAQARHIKVIATLIDLYLPKDHGGRPWFYPAGALDFYSDDDGLGGELTLRESFFTEGYKQHYLPFVATVVAQNRGHAGLYAWEPGNELRSSSLVPFLQETTALIKQLDPHTKIAAGIISAAHGLRTGNPADATALYGALPNLDYATLHFYPDDPNAPRAEDLQEIVRAAAAGKPTIVEELGIWRPGPDRVDRTRQELATWAALGVKAIVVWGWALPGSGDDIFVPEEPDATQLAQVFDSFAV